MKGTEGGDADGWNGTAKSHAAECHVTLLCLPTRVREHNRKDIRCFT